MRQSNVKYVFRFLTVSLLVLISSRAVFAGTDSFRHDIEVFFSTGMGNIVFILLLLLIMLWLLLPLAVFGQKRKMREIIRQTRKTNRLLTKIREQLRAISEDETMEPDTEQAQKSADPDMAELYDQIRFDP
jgi:hypothetical protein